MSNSRMAVIFVMIALSFLSMSLFVGSAGAASIGSADIVTVNGIEWAQVDLFIDLSWSQINLACPGGVCAGTTQLNGFDMTGWTWATAQEVGDELFSEISPHPAGIAQYTEENSLWAPATFDIVGFRPTFENQVFRYVFGYSSQEYPLDTTTVYFPFIQTAKTLTGTLDIADTSARGNKTDVQDDLGAWFFRPAAPVPEPSTMLLLVIALLGVAGVHRKIKSQN